MPVEVICESSNSPNNSEIDLERQRKSEELKKLRQQKQAEIQTSFIEQIVSKSLQHGPLSMLYKAMKERMRVKVVIRRVAEIRGHCSGFVDVYDKHFNLVLSEVEESWVDSAATPNSLLKTRKVKQLFIKGDSVVCVILLTSS